MNVNKVFNGSDLTVEVSGRLDTVTAPQLESEVLALLDGVTSLTIDLADLEYISSAGLRVLLAIQKKMKGKGSMTVKNINDTISEIFEVTGFLDILNIG